MAYEVEVKKIGNKQKLVITTDFLDPPKDFGSPKTDRVATSGGNAPCGVKTKDGRDIVIGFNAYAYKQ